MKTFFILSSVTLALAENASPSQKNQLARKDTQCQFEQVVTLSFDQLNKIFQSPQYAECINGGSFPQNGNDDIENSQENVSTGKEPPVNSNINESQHKQSKSESSVPEEPNSKHNGENYKEFLGEARRIVQKKVDTFQGFDLGQ